MAIDYIALNAWYRKSKLSLAVTSQSFVDSAAAGSASIDPERPLSNFTRKLIGQKGGFTLKQLERLLSFVNDRLEAAGFTGLSRSKEDFEKGGCGGGGERLFEWVWLPVESQDAQQYWEAWRLAYEQIFKYQPERDNPDIFIHAREETETAIHLAPTDRDWERYRSRIAIGGLYSETDKRFELIVQVNIDACAEFCLGGWIGASETSPENALRAAVPIIASECRRIARVAPEGRLALVYEVDRPLGDSEIAWNLLAKATQSGQSEDTRAQLREKYLAIDDRHRADLIKVIKRIRALAGAFRGRAITDKGGHFFNYVQPDLREVIPQDAKGRPMWLFVVPLTDAYEYPAAAEAVKFLYEHAYVDMYRLTRDQNDPYFDHLEQIATPRLSSNELGGLQVSAKAAMISEIASLVRKIDGDLWGQVLLRPDDY